MPSRYERPESVTQQKELVMYRKIIPLDEATATRFWSNVDIRNKDQCWEWKAGKWKAGYGIFRYAGNIWVASRISYYLSNGPFDERLMVCHHCDWTSCVSPNCLFADTAKGNTNDAQIKGRWNAPKGEENGHAKFTDETVKEAFKMYQDGQTLNMIASMFSVSKSMVWNIIHLRNWKHIELPKIQTDYKRKLTEDQVIDMHRLFRQGMSKLAISKRFGVSDVLVCNIINGKSWAHVSEKLTN